MLVKLNVRKSVCVKRVSVRSTRSVNSVPVPLYVSAIRSTKGPVSSRNRAFLWAKYFPVTTCHIRRAPILQGLGQGRAGNYLVRRVAFHYHSAKFISTKIYLVDA